MLVPAGAWGVPGTQGCLPDEQLLAKSQRDVRGRAVLCPGMALSICCSPLPLCWAIQLLCGISQCLCVSDPIPRDFPQHMNLGSGQLWCAGNLCWVRGACCGLDPFLFGCIRQNFLPLLQGQQSPPGCKQRPVVHQYHLQEVKKDPWTQLLQSCLLSS